MCSPVHYIGHAKALSWTYYDLKNEFFSCMCLEEFFSFTSLCYSSTYNMAMEGRGNSTFLVARISSWLGSMLKTNTSHGAVKKKSNKWKLEKKLSKNCLNGWSEITQSSRGIYLCLTCYAPWLGPMLCEDVYILEGLPTWFCLEEPESHKGYSFIAPLDIWTLNVFKFSSNLEHLFQHTLSKRLCSWNPVGTCLNIWLISPLIN